MIYILIVLWFGSSQSYSGKAALAVEFNSKAACQAAASEIRKQSGEDDPYGHRVGVILCAEKGQHP